MKTLLKKYYIYSFNRFFEKQYNLIFLLVLFSIGCSNPFGSNKSYVDPNYGNSNTKTVGTTGQEFVSGSQLGVTTNKGKKIDVTVGAKSNEIRLVTNKNKIIYLNVQGQMGVIK